MCIQPVAAGVIPLEQMRKSKFTFVMAVNKSSSMPMIFKMGNIVHQIDDESLETVSHSLAVQPAAKGLSWEDNMRKGLFYELRG
jgi:hypothetical protein